MTSPYSLQQLKMIQEMQRQQFQQLQHQMIMGGLINTNANSVHIPGVMMIPPQVTPNMSKLQSLDFGSPPIVVVESDEEDEDDEEMRTLFVANLDDRVTEELLYEVFVQTGPIERVRIPKDNSGRQRTFGFVTFTHRCSPPYAMHLLQGVSLYRKTLTIKFNGKSFPPPLKSPILGLRNGTEKKYDNQALRGGGNYSSYMDKTPSSSRHQDRQSKQSSNQTRSHTNSNPFHQQPPQRRDSPNHYNDKRRYHNNHKNSGNNNGNNRNFDHRGSSSSSVGGKYRR